eukprot:6324390-Alexandrium_andersonii.AAC.1
MLAPARDLSMPRARVVGRSARMRRRRSGSERALVTALESGPLTGGAPADLAAVGRVEGPAP